MIVRAIAAWLVFLYFKIFFRLKVVGKKRVPKGAVILAANHASFFDPPLMGSVLWPDVPFFLARGTLFNSKAFSWLLRQLRSLPIKRGEENAALFRQVVKVTKEGKKVALFPEGTRSKSGDLQEALPGIGLLVVKANCPVVPVYVAGTYEAWSCHRKKPKLFGKITLVFGDPIDFSKRGEDRKQLTRQIGGEIMQEIAKLKESHDAHI